MEIFSDQMMRAVEAGLDGVAARQRVTAHNIANVATPGFRSTRLAFEDALRDAVQRGDVTGVVPSSIAAANTPVRQDGNDVDLEDETAILVRAGVQYEALAEALSYKIALYRSAIGG